MAERIPHGPIVERRAGAHTICLALDKLCVSRLDVLGLDNLAMTADLLGSGSRAIWFPNHLTDADGSILIKAMRENGHGRIADKNHFIVGTMIMKNLVKRFLTHGYHGIVVPADRDESISKEIRSQMVRNALAEATRVFNAGDPLTVFAEGGKSYTGKMRRVKPNIAVYLRLNPQLIDKTYVQPVGIVAVKIWPVRSPVPLPRRSGLVNFGQPIPLKQLYDVTTDYSGVEKDQMMVDLVMCQVAKLLPERYRGYYGYDQSSLIIPPNSS